jgi:hypothetical protein
VKKFKGEVLIFAGKDMTLAAKAKDVKVLIGQQFCNVTNLISNQVSIVLVIFF